MTSATCFLYGHPELPRYRWNFIYFIMMDEATTLYRKMGCV